ncbi:42665_t:CDS:2, partial [Gigaspora margarita]
TPIIQTPSLTASSSVESVPSVKRKNSEETSELINVDFINNNDIYKSETNEEHPIRTTCGSKKLRHTTVDNVKSDKE